MDLSMQIGLLNNKINQLVGKWMWKSMKPVPGGGFHQQTMDRQIWDQMWNSASMCFLCYLYIYIVLYVFQGDVQLCTQLKQCDMYISEIQQTIMYIYIYIYLVGSVPTPLKNMISSVGVIIPKYMESQKNSCSKPPTRWWWLLSHYIDDYYPITWILWVMYIYILQLCRWNPAEISLFGNTESESKSSIPAITGCIQVWVYQTQHKPW